MRSSRRITLAAAALAMAAGPALADYGASASLTGITFELVDLRPDDGIAPSANIVVGGRGVTSHIFGLNGCGPHCHTAVGAFDEPLMVSESFAGATVFASVSGAGMVASASGKPGPNAAKQSGAFSFMSFSGGGEPNFFVGPHTGVRMTGTYAVDAWVDAAPGSPTEFAGAHVVARAWGQSVDFTERVQVSTDPAGGPLHANGAGQFSFTFENARDHGRGMTGGIFVTATGRPVLPVPEPSTYALFATGLGLIGVVAKRRQNQGT